MTSSRGVSSVRLLNKAKVGVYDSGSCTVIKMNATAGVGTYWPYVKCIYLAVAVLYAQLNSQLPLTIIITNIPHIAQ